MEPYLSAELRDGLDTARKAALTRASRLRIGAGDITIPVLRAWNGGFAMESSHTPALRGRVAMYEGARLISYCLIIASEEEGGEIRFEYKRMTDASAQQPLDFHLGSTAPVALLEQQGDY